MAEFLDMEFLKQLPYVAITLAVVFWFVRIMREDRDKADARETERDKTFATAMKETTAMQAGALDRNSEVLREIEKTITRAQYPPRNGNHAA